MKRRKSALWTLTKLSYYEKMSSFFSGFSLRVILQKAYSVTTEIGELVLNNTWGKFSQNTPPIIEIKNRNINQYEPLTTDLSVMIARCSLDRQNVGPIWHPAIVGWWFRYTNYGQSNHTNQRHQNRIWTREDDYLVRNSYFRSNPTQWVYRKRMVKRGKYVLDFGQQANYSMSKLELW